MSKASVEISFPLAAFPLSPFPLIVHSACHAGYSDEGPGSKRFFFQTLLVYCFATATASFYFSVAGFFTFSVTVVKLDA